MARLKSASAGTAKCAGCLSVSYGRHFHRPPHGGFCSRFPGPRRRQFLAAGWAHRDAQRSSCGWSFSIDRAAMAGFATCGSASRVSDRIPFKVADPRPQPFRIEARSVPMQDGRSSRGRPMKAPMLLASARLSAIAALFLATFPTILMGQTSEEYAAMGQKIWVAFECGALAEYADKPEESRRLYNLGYDQGKTLLDAFRGKGRSTS
jgi:hypothetical protein